MKHFLSLCIVALLFACSADDSTVTEENVTLFVNHYKTTSVVGGTQLLIQEDNGIGHATFQKTTFIKNFDFEPGYTYIITAKKITTEHAGTDAVSVFYEMDSVEEKKAIPPQTTFTIPLARFVNGVGYVSFIQGTSAHGFMLSAEIKIDCMNICTQLEYITPNQESATGLFTHGPEGIYILQDIY